ncbi:hypothetical protein TeGR_g1528 [Tetraparma gracilis]|uniref:Uncharacterized protein n=1 Tax=Tetraparma gracilis TaxID=2962635 RepID=A0ABQ6MEY7_9STRA|nr:hypothetical protein TeGR_g1528 [Tetraparma gracilis]
MNSAPYPHSRHSDTESDGTCENDALDDWCSDDSGEIVHVPRVRAVRAVGDDEQWESGGTRVEERIVPTSTKAVNQGRDKGRNDWQDASYDEEEEYELC